MPAGKATLGTPGNTDDEKEHAYETKGFWLGKYEVTQEQWQAVMGADPSHFKGAKLPVEKVSWEDCQKFLKKCGVKGLRLPHEDAWEYAYRGGKGNKQAYYWGDTLNDQANNGSAKTTEVGSYESKAKHPWGLCDMSGNVWEWCDNLHSVGGSTLVVRSGSWSSGSYYCRAACRFNYEPGYRSFSVGFRVLLGLD